MLAMAWGNKKRGQSPAITHYFEAAPYRQSVEISSKLVCLCSYNPSLGRFRRTDNPLKSVSKQGLTVNPLKSLPNSSVCLHASKLREISRTDNPLKSVSKQGRIGYPFFPPIFIFEERRTDPFYQF